MRPEPCPAAGEDGYTAAWCDTPTIVNLRGRPDDAAFMSACGSALGLALPTQACRTVQRQGLRILWAGPDDWFLLAEEGDAAALYGRLRAATTGLHVAVTDVSSGYRVLRLAGRSARDVLAGGCPIDLHPRAFAAGCCVGTQLFKASVWLWRPGEADTFELLVRRSFAGYVDLMLSRSRARA